MQLAIIVIVFLVGFSVAVALSLGSKKARADLERLHTNVQHVFGAPKLRPIQAGAPREAHTAQTEEAGHGADFLLTTAQVEKFYGLDSWQRQVFEDIKVTLLAQGDGRKTFPCVYATKGLKDNQHRYVFLKSSDPAEPQNIRILGEALRAYIPQSRSIGRNTSIVVVTPPTCEQLSFDDYRQRFWSTLRALRVYDTKPWPEEVPCDVESNTWAFCFDGSPIFPVALTPLHEKRKSRWAPSFCIALQPKWVFDHLLSTPQKRNGATDKVRALLKEYDTIDPSPSLTAYGAPGTTEAHQLFMVDDNDLEEQCPYEDFDAGWRTSKI